MFRFPAAPVPPTCTHTPTYTHQFMYTCRIRIPQLAQHVTAGQQVASCSLHLLPVHVYFPPSLSPHAQLQKTGRSEAERCFCPLLATPLLLPTHCYMAIAPRAIHPPSHMCVLHLRSSEEREELLATPCVASTATPSGLMPQPVSPPPPVSACRKERRAHCPSRATPPPPSHNSPVHIHNYDIHKCE